MKVINRKTANEHLFLSIARGDVVSLERSLAMGANANARKDGNDSITALMAAARDGHARCLHRLIESGADVNYANNIGTTALMVAAFNDFADCVQALIVSGANVDDKNENGDAAIDLTVNSDCIRMLAEAGAGIESLRTDYPDEYRIALSAIEAKNLREKITKSANDSDNISIGL